ncbi:MAG: hypothetical protein ACRERE_16240 [Candidatus Entotheonellia bacterium]
MLGWLYGLRFDDVDPVRSQPILPVFGRGHDGSVPSGFPLPAQHLLVYYQPTATAKARPARVPGAEAARLWYDGMQTLGRRV